MKKASMLLVLFLLISVLLLSCTSQNFSDPEQSNKAIEWIVASTEKAIVNKDIKLARTIWSEISEYGVKASSMGKDDLGDKLGSLASCYEYLVKYLETGDKKLYEKFQDNYSSAMEDLQAVIDLKE
ncbi:MAG: hypothetical protein WAO24_04545 [Peptococcia bacterium]